MMTLDRTRIGIGAQALGIAQGALDLAVSYAKERKQFGRPIAENQGIQFMLADMAAKVEASRLLVYNAGQMIDDGEADHVLMEDVSWEFYEELLLQTPHRHLRITYDEGRLELMSPLPRHERIKKLVAVMVAVIAMERIIPMRQLGSTTFRRRKRYKGLEPDECFYVQSEWDNAGEACLMRPLAITAATFSSASGLLPGQSVPFNASADDVVTIKRKASIFA